MMVGANNTKSSTNKPPASSAPTGAAASSSSHDPKSRWASSNNDGGSSKNNNNINNNSNSKPTTGGVQKNADTKLPKPNPSPKLAPVPNQSHPNHSNPTAQSSRPAPGSALHAASYPFPDSSAALGAPPAPTYGFHMLERRTIVLVDGSVRSYFALPPNYQDFPPRSRLADPAANRFMGPEFGRFPPFHPEEFRDQRQLWDRQEGSMKRKYPGEEEFDRRDERGEMMRQRQQFMHYANPNDQPLMAGTSSPFRRDVGEDARAAKHMRIGSSRHENGAQELKHFQVSDQVAIKKSFLDFVKRIYEDPSEKKNYLENGSKGRLQCLVCGRSPKDVQDTHGLVMHAYCSDDANTRVHHLGLHKALCVLMGWNFSKAPDNSKAYQNLPAEVAAVNQDQLIIWPPHVIVHNTSTGKGKDGRMEGLGSKRMDSRMRELKITGGKSKSLYGREGHLGITLFRFAGDDSGLMQAMRMAECFEKMNRGRKSWAKVPPFTPGIDDEKNRSIVEVDDRTGEKKRVLYGYLATIADLDKVDMETKKKTTIESLRELAGSK
uniref:XS domain-containing protein n=1 Tax=Noccaea caerulescens TaxID=107243 RepID=A0A1J3F8I4_NOCCA